MSLIFFFVLLQVFRHSSQSCGRVVFGRLFVRARARTSAHKHVQAKCQNPDAASSLVDPPTQPATFLPRACDAILLFSLKIGNPTGATDHMFVVHRGLFTDAINLSTDEDANIDVVCEDWVPQCTRWLDAADLSTQYITTIAGQRMVTTAHDASERTAPIRVLDFNALSVEAQRIRGPV
ncbi:hypothetical protein DFH09DRAFT_1324234 [Mycena vulgaris]|nr:hypothetical protein DFH09DRAFT_1324234 [Mycena vulgaris]